MQIVIIFSIVVTNRDHLIIETAVKTNCTYAACLKFSVLLHCRFDAAQTCPEPWSFVDRQAKLLKVQVCHLTQFALFWTFQAENGLIEFKKGNNGTFL